MVRLQSAMGPVMRKLTEGLGFGGFGGFPGMDMGGMDMGGMGGMACGQGGQSAAGRQWRPAA